MVTVALFVTSQRADFHKPKSEKMDLCHFSTGDRVDLLIVEFAAPSIDAWPTRCRDHTQDVADRHIHTVDRCAHEMHGQLSQWVWKEHEDDLF